MASVLVRCFFSAAGISVSSFGSLSIPPLAPPIIGSIWVGAVGPCSAGCIPIGPVLSDGSRLLGMTSQRTTVIFVRLFRRRVEGEEALVQFAAEPVTTTAVTGPVAGRPVVWVS
jgi:hypothetical protein